MITTERAAQRALLAAAMTHDEVDEAVRARVKALGGLAYHTFDSRRSARGFPDWTIVVAGRVLFWEVKTQRGRVTPAQKDWIRRLLDAGVHARVIRPIDVLDGTVDRLLGIRPAQPVARPAHAGLR